MTTLCFFHGNSYADSMSEFTYDIKYIEYIIPIIFTGNLHCSSHIVFWCKFRIYVTEKISDMYLIDMVFVCISHGNHGR